MMQRKERADCTVSALAHAASIDYTLAHAIAHDAGRRGGGRFRSEKLLKEAKRQGVVFHKIRLAGKTLGKFLRTHPTGRYYVHKRGHALSVVDGVAGDGTPHGSILTAAWQLIRVAPCKSDELTPTPLVARLGGCTQTQAVQ